MTVDTTAFWKDLEDALEDVEAEKRVLEALKSDTALVASLKNDDGLTITEFLCEQEANAGIRDFLDNVIEAGGIITDNCYRAILNHSSSYSYDMIRSLIQSGYFPIELDGRKTLDWIVEETCKRNEIDEDECFEVLEDVLSPLMDDFSGEEPYEKARNERMKKGLPKLETGKTHEEDGYFSRFAAYYKAQKEKPASKESASPAVKKEETPPKVKKETKKNSKQPPTSSLNTATTTKTTNEPSPRSVVLKNNKDTVVFVCPVCKKDMGSTEKLQEHLTNQSGKAHKRYRDNNKEALAQQPASKRVKKEA